MQDRPDRVELARAIGEFLRSELLPTVSDPRLSFRLRVAINGLGILERELEAGDLPLRDECLELTRHLGEGAAIASPNACRDPRSEAVRLNALLARRLRRGDRPPGTHALLLRLSLAKLAIASPGVLAGTTDGGPA